MHELSVTQSILSIVLEKADEAEASRVSQINLVIGELSGIVSDCVQFYFDLLSRETAAATASIIFQTSPTRLRCRKCEVVFSPDNGNWGCPTCRQPTVDIVTGRELYIESIEVE